MKPRLLVLSLIAAGMLAAAAGGYAKYGTGFVHTAAVSAPAAAAAQPAPAAAAGAALPDFSSIVSRYGAAVVNISVTGKAVNAGWRQEMPEMDPSNPFFQFFRQFQVPAPRSEVPTQGLGSGFIVSPDGVILTNAHVVSGAKDVTVKLTDKREFKAKVIGIDKPSDVAVLKIDASGLPTVALDDGGPVRVGEWVVAIGSPYGFDNTVTAGIVSAKARALPDANYVPFIQTDVAVNPGNSGGPLFNMQGKVIGINSQIYTRSGGYQGLSFAIPINVALHVKDQLIAHGTVTRGRLGITIQDVNQGLADAFGLDRPQGALVSAVDKDGPAAKAGIEPGDVILSYDGTTIHGSTELPALVADTKPGKEVALTVARKHDRKEITVSVGELPHAKLASADAAGVDHGRLGLLVRPLTPDEKKQAGGIDGLLVEDASGPAANAGIQAGDVVLSVNNSPVRSVEELQALVSKAARHVALLVQRGGNRLYVPVEIG